MILEKWKKNTMNYKKVFLFEKISSSFIKLLAFTNEALIFLAKKQQNIIYQLQIINEKIKKNEIYPHTGFSAILKNIEGEIEGIDSNTQIDEVKIKKITEYYGLLKKTLEESIVLLDDLVL